MMEESVGVVEKKNARRKTYMRGMASMKFFYKLLCHKIHSYDTRFDFNVFLYS